MTDTPRDFNAELLAALRPTPSIRSAQIEDADGGDVPRVEVG
ncbi:MULTISPECIES: hypothetical protein [Streptomyces]|uniref:Uncharacterized protein n=1 Tax=Streptomyces flavovirens TaxID=52258 RepID=A0ABV8NBX6_9ACTN|nr:hypothetical protein [Streptomyces sp. MBT51]